MQSRQRRTSLGSHHLAMDSARASDPTYANGHASGSQQKQRDIFVDPLLLPLSFCLPPPPPSHSQSHTTVAELAAIAALSRPLPPSHSVSALQHIQASKGLNDALEAFAPPASPSLAPSPVAEGKRRAESEDELKEEKRGRGRPKGKKDGEHVNKEKRGRPKGAKNVKGLKQEREERERREKGLPDPEPKKRCVGWPEDEVNGAVCAGADSLAGAEEGQRARATNQNRVRRRLRRLSPRSRRF